MTVGSRWTRALLLTLALACVPGRARAGWLSPAAGPTATGDPEIVLTFDDGPNPQTTGRVLDTLKAHHARAVFFVVGDRLGPDDKVGHALVARMLREGHIVANHTVTHLQLCAVPPEIAAAEIDGAAATITALTGMKAPWFRSPYGAYCPRLEAMLSERQIHHFYWDLDSQEWRHNNAKRATAYMIRALSRLQGRSVLLMHDTKLATVRALPKILDWLDAENQKRVAATQRPIRIVDPAVVAREMVAPGLVDWLVEAGTAGLAAVATAAAALP